MMCLLLLAVGATSVYAQQQQRKDTLVVARDGTGEYRNIQEAVEAVRAFMDYTVTIYIKNGIYKEKLVIPSWVKNVQLVGESAEKTIITYDDHANINKMGTFRTYTVKVEGNDITFKDLTIENNAAPLGQAVALHTEGDRLMFVNCRFLGNQDTIYTGTEGARLLFTNCYIEGTTDFIFGPSTALFEYCELHSKRDSYITAASTPQSEEFGYVFKNCKLTAAPGVKKVYLGRPWRPYAATVFINCEFGNHIRPEGWHNWRNPENEKTARYAEFGNTGAGADASGRVAWAKQLTNKEAMKYTPQNIFIRQPEQGAADVEGGVGVGDLPGNDFQLRAFGGDKLHQPDEPGQQHRRQQAPAEVEAAVGQRGAGGVLSLPDAGQQGRDRRADVVP